MGGIYKTSGAFRSPDSVTCLLVVYKESRNKASGALCIDYNKKQMYRQAQKQSISTHFSFGWLGMNSQSQQYCLRFVNDRYL